MSYRSITSSIGRRPTAQRLHIAAAIQSLLLLLGSGCGAPKDDSTVAESSSSVTHGTMRIRAGSSHETIRGTLRISSSGTRKTVYGNLRVRSGGGTNPPPASNPRIRLTAAMTPLYDVDPSGQHGWMTDNCGYRAGHAPPGDCGGVTHYGAWLDGPANPIRVGNETRIFIPMSEWNYIRVPDITGAIAPGGRSLAQPTSAAEVVDESQYDNRHWSYGPYVTSGQNVVMLTHHEFYRPQDRNMAGGLDYLIPYRKWIIGVGHARSSNGGNSWSMAAPSQGRPAHGFGSGTQLHRAQRDLWLWSPDEHRLRLAVAILLFRSDRDEPARQLYGSRRVSDAHNERSITWRMGVLNDSWGWTPVNRNTWQGNFNSGQTPKVLWSDSLGCGHVYAMNLRQHRASGKFIFIGSKWCTDTPNCWQATYAVTSNLSNPRDLEASLRTIEDNRPGGFCMPDRPYYSLFDVDGSADRNYQTVGDQPLLVSVVQQHKLYHSFVQLSGF